MPRRLTYFRARAFVRLWVMLPLRLALLGGVLIALLDTCTRGRVTAQARKVKLMLRYR